MQLKELGEFGLIDLIKKDTIVNPDTIVAGIGDDAAVLVPSPGQLQLLTTDMLVEGIHFDLRTSTAWQLGYKAIAVNVSDIAAMGGVAKHAVVSLAIPERLTVEFILALYEGMKAICHEVGVNIAGGDTVSSLGGLVINVAVSGEVEPAKLQRRAGAACGDVVAVTGDLGNSACGLALLQQGGWEDHSFAEPLITSHLTPRPQVKAGPMLAGMGSTSMNDISDGLASEVNEIAAASGVGMCIYRDSIPLSPELKAAAAHLGQDPVEFAMYGGEDYQLLFTMPPDTFRMLNDIDFDIKLTPIGRVVRREQGITLVNTDKSTCYIEPRGYNHFR